MEHTVTIKILNFKIKSMSFKKRISIWFIFTTLVLLINIDDVQSQTINNGAISVGFAFGIQSSSNGQTIINNGSITSRNDAINVDNHLNVIVINNGSIITNTIGQAMGISGGSGVSITNSSTGIIRTSTNESFGIYIPIGNNGSAIMLPGE